MITVGWSGRVKHSSLRQLTEQMASDGHGNRVSDALIVYYMADRTKLLVLSPNT